MSFLLAVAVVTGLVSLGMWIEGQRLAKETERTEDEQTAWTRALLDALAPVAGELGLEQSALAHEYTGTMSGFPARLTIGGVGVMAFLPRFPAGLSIAPRPRGRAQEDIGFTSVTVDHPEAQKWVVVGRAGQSPDLLAAEATQIDPAVFALLTETWSPLVDVTLAAEEICVRWNWTSPLKSPIEAHFGYVTAWREAERIVKLGVERGLFALHP